MGTVKPCWSSNYNGIACLESEDEFMFFKSQEDRRPSQCTIIKKNKVPILSQCTLNER